MNGRGDLPFGPLEVRFPGRFGASVCCPRFVVGILEGVGVSGAHGMSQSGFEALTEGADELVGRNVGEVADVGFELGEVGLEVVFMHPVAVELGEELLLHIGGQEALDDALDKRIPGADIGAIEEAVGIGAEGNAAEADSRFFVELAGFLDLLEAVEPVKEGGLVTGERGEAGVFVRQVNDWGGRRAVGG